MPGVDNMPLIDFYLDSQAAIITLNNPQAGNVLNQKSMAALQAALALAISNAEIRVIVLRSSGDPFCLGMDLAELQSMEQDYTIAERTIALYVELLSSIYNAPQPVICLVQGAVKAGGVGLVGACDIVLATEKASFEMSEVILGLIPANVLPFVYSLRLPPQKLRYLVLTAKKITVDEAQRLNLVDEVILETEMPQAVKAVIKKLFRASPAALAETKRFTQALFGKKTDQATLLAKEKLLEMIKNPEVIKAIRAFNDGDMPSWFGKFKPEKPLVIQGEA